MLTGLAVGIAESAVSGVLQLGIAAAAFVLNSPVLTALLQAILGGILGIAITPFSVATSVVLYYELRARAEGYDLVQRMQQLAPAE
jgi:hypothetical protein